MKEKEPESYIEKPRVHRDRTKKRRLTADEAAENESIKPKMEPYKRKKDWMQLPNDEDGL